MLEDLIYQYASDNFDRIDNGYIISMEEMDAFTRFIKENHPDGGDL